MKTANRHPIHGSEIQKAFPVLCIIVKSSAAGFFMFMFAGWILFFMIPNADAAEGFGPATVVMEGAIEVNVPSGWSRMEAFLFASQSNRALIDMGLWIGPYSWERIRCALIGIMLLLFCTWYWISLTHYGMGGPHSRQG